MPSDPMAAGFEVMAAANHATVTEVLRLLAQGHTYREAADRLGVSVKTIETHRKHLSDKLGLRSRAQLFRFAVEVGLLERE